MVMKEEICEVHRGAKAKRSLLFNNRRGKILMDRKEGNL